MGKRLFISYNHAQQPWIQRNLVPCLRAGGADVLIDYEQFGAGQHLVGQMDAIQDSAEVSVLVLSPEYLTSTNCLHEMHRAINRHAATGDMTIIPVKRDNSDLPAPLKALGLLYVNLSDDTQATQWDSLLNACGADLGVSAPAWLQARNEVQRLLLRDQSANLVVTGYPRWRELLTHLRGEPLSDLKVVDLDNGATALRSGLVEEILKTCGLPSLVPRRPKGEDLVVLQRVLAASPHPPRLALLRFDRVKDRADTYDVNFFAALNHLVEYRHLVLLIESRSPVKALIPQDRLSSFDIKLHVVELTGRP